MRRKVATEERIWPRSSELRNPTETPVARATCARESPRRVRSRRKRWPGSVAASAAERRALALQHVHDCRGIQSASASKKQRALQQAHVGFGVQTIAALGALRSDQAKLFPRAQRGRRNSYSSRHFTDTQRQAPRLLG